LKTLIVEVGDKPVRVVAPSDHEVNAKELAILHSEARLERDASSRHRTTDRLPRWWNQCLAQKERIPTTFEETALSRSTVFLVTDNVAHQIEFEPSDARKVLDVIVRPLTA